MMPARSIGASFQPAVAGIYTPLHHLSPYNPSFIYIVRNPERQSYVEQGIAGKKGLPGGMCDQIVLGSVEGLSYAGTGEKLYQPLFHALIREFIEECVAQDRRKEAAQLFERYVRYSASQQITSEIVEPLKATWWPTADSVLIMPLEDAYAFHRLVQMIPQEDLLALTNGEISEIGVTTLQTACREIENYGLGTERVALLNWSHHLLPYRDLQYRRDLGHEGGYYPFETGNGVQWFRILDTNPNALNEYMQGTVSAVKHGTQLIERAAAGGFITTHLGQHMYQRHQVNPGDLIATCLKVDETGRVVRTGNTYPMGYSPEDLPAKGFYPAGGMAGLFNTRSGQVCSVLPYTVREPTVILNAHGQGVHSFAMAGDTILMRARADGTIQIYALTRDEYQADWSPLQAAFVGNRNDPLHMPKTRRLEQEHFGDGRIPEPYDIPEYQGPFEPVA